MTIWHVAPDGALGGGAVIMARLLREVSGGGDPPAHIALLPRNADPDMAALFDGLPVRRGYYEGRANPLLFARAIAAEARRGDVIHAHGTRAALAGALARLIQPGLKLIYTVHGFHGLAQPGPFGIRARLEALLARICDGVVFVSAADCDLAAAHGLRYRGIARVIENGVDVPPAPLGATKDVDVIFIGRLVTQKHPEAFIDLAARLPEGARIEMIGDGDLAERIDRLNVATGSRALRLGALPRGEALARLARAKVLAMTSRWEGLPTAAIEAGMSRAAVAGYSIPPLAEILGNQAGACLTAPDPDALAAVVTRLLRDDAERIALADALHDRTRALYSPARMAAMHRTLYADIIAA
ncbi:MAG: glycosyltransferase involved in cell wall biosynthesis [Paracoccaceae bacterium]|jgi:glycosyltransferase involved in cell wall biosynthesis